MLFFRINATTTFSIVPEYEQNKRDKSTFKVLQIEYFYFYFRSKYLPTSL